MAREYKDSGIEWIGEIPKEWNVTSFKRFHKKANVGESIDKSYCTNNIEDLLFYTAGIEPIHTTYKEFPSWKYTRKRDLLLARNGTPYVYLPITDAAYSDHIIRVEINDNLVKEFISYSLQQAISYVVVDSVSIATWSISLWDKQFVAIPPLQEQQKIADYLDKVCGEADEMIALQEKMIEELKAYKQSVITEAVTKGLNSNDPMKDSGIDWIGEIPEGWKVIQTKRIVRNHLQGYYDADGYVASGYRLLRITDLLNDGNLTLTNAPFVKETSNIKEFILQRGDFCFARTGGAGSFGFVSENIEPAVFASYLIRFRFSGQNNNYLRYYFLSNCFISEVNSLIHGGVNKNINAENIKETHLPIPSLSEQSEIASYLDTKCSDIDSLISIKQQKIDELKEYKRSVIYEYVTGKKEVI